MKKSIAKTIGIVAAFVLGQLVLGFIFICLSVAVSPDLVKRAYTETEYYNSYMLYMSIFAIAAMDVLLIPAFLFLTHRKNIKPFKTLKGCQMDKWLIFTAASWIVMLLWAFVIPKSWSNETNELLAESTSPFVMLVMCILAPINEEIVFRYGIIRSFNESHKKAAVIISAIAFALVHGNLAQGIPAFITGLILAIAFAKTGNIAVTMICHIFYNVSSEIATLTSPVMIFAAFILVFGFIEIYKKLHIKNIKSQEVIVDDQNELR